MFLSEILFRSYLYGASKSPVKISTEARSLQRAERRKPRVERETSKNDVIGWVR